MTRALQLVRQARIAGCALPHCMHRGAVELHSEARRLPPSPVSCSFLTFFCQSFVASSPDSSGVGKAQRAGAAGACWLRVLVWVVVDASVAACLTLRCSCARCARTMRSTWFWCLVATCACAVFAQVSSGSRACDLSVYQCVSVLLCRQGPGSKLLRHEDYPPFTVYIRHRHASCRCRQSHQLPIVPHHDIAARAHVPLVTGSNGCCFGLKALDARRVQLLGVLAASKSAAQRQLPVCITRACGQLDRVISTFH